MEGIVHGVLSPKTLSNCAGLPVHPHSHWDRCAVPFWHLTDRLNGTVMRVGLYCLPVDHHSKRPCELSAAQCQEPLNPGRVARDAHRSLCNNAAALRNRIGVLAVAGPQAAATGGAQSTTAKRPSRWLSQAEGTCRKEPTQHGRRGARKRSFGPWGHPFPTPSPAGEPVPHASGSNAAVRGSMRGRSEKLPSKAAPGNQREVPQDGRRAPKDHPRLRGRVSVPPSAPGSPLKSSVSSMCDRFAASREQFPSRTPGAPVRGCGSSFLLAGDGPR